MSDRTSRWPEGFPEVMGVEEETGLMVNHGSGWEDPNILAGNISDYMPPIAFSGTSSLFLQNGGLIYPGGGVGVHGADNVERATPECTGLSEVAAYIQANGRLMVEIATNYAQKMSCANGARTQVRIQRRVVDSHNNRKACHDNFGVNNVHEYIDGIKRHVLVGHLATRSFITGAGHVTAHGLRYAQKIDGLKDIYGYGYEGYMYRTAGRGGSYYDTTGDRLEVRCSDINISPWAIVMRLGATGLLMASLETPLAQQIYGMSPARDPLQLAREMNRVPINEDGVFTPNRDTMQAVDFQERLADMYLDDLQLYIELPIEYYSIALELKRYCEDYRKVLKNQAPLSLLADRSDMAAKFTKILSAHDGFMKHEDRHILAARDDLLYDYIGVDAEPNSPARVRYGYGYKLRDKGIFKGKLSDHAVAGAYFNPPKDTRARIRGEAIRRYMLATVDWDRMEVMADKLTTIYLPDPLQATLDDEMQAHLESHAVRR